MGNGVSASSRVAMFSQAPLSSSGQVQSALMRQYSVGRPLETLPVQYAAGGAVETTPIRKAVGAPQYSPRQTQRQTQPVVMLSGLPAHEFSATPPAAVAVSPPQVTREINTDFEVIALRQQMVAMEGLVDDLRQEIGTLRTRLSAEDQAPKSAEVALEAQKTIVIDELRQEIEDQRQELSELQRLREIIEDQGAEIQELRAKTVMLAASNEDLEARKVELEQVLEVTAQVDGQAIQTTVEGEQRAEIRVSEIIEDNIQNDIVEEAPLEIEQVRTPPSPGRKMRPLRGDAIDALVQEYLDSCPDFRLVVEKIKPGWYIFGEPISKKLYLKMSGEHVVCRVGGGTKDLIEYLEDFRLSTYDKKDQEVARARVKRLSSREHRFRA